jgi:hypothetical protein
MSDCVLWIVGLGGAVIGLTVLMEAFCFVGVLQVDG